MDQLDWENGFEAILTDRIVLTDTYIKMSPVPSTNVGRVVIEDNSPTNYEIVHFTSKDANGIYVDARNEDSNSTGIHARGARVRMNITAQDLKEIRDYAQNVVDNSGVPVVSTEATPTILTPTSSQNVVIVSALANSLTMAAPTGTPAEAQSLMVRIKDNGTSRSITWNAIYRAIGVTLPTATVANKELYVAMRYNSLATKWDVTAVGREA